MRDIQKLYQQTILEHNKHPRNYGGVDMCEHTAHGNNPICGDSITVGMQLEDGIVSKVLFDGDGCAIAKASGSMMTEALMGKSMQDAQMTIKEFVQMLTEDGTPMVGKLHAFQGVKQFPARVKCATLAWRTAEACLEGKQQASTE